MSKNFEPMSDEELEAEITRLNKIVKALKRTQIALAGVIVVGTVASIVIDQIQSAKEEFDKH